jgi:hypothetical protein
VCTAGPVLPIASYAMCHLHCECQKQKHFSFRNVRFRRVSVVKCVFAMLVWLVCWTHDNCCLLVWLKWWRTWHPFSASTEQTSFHHHHCQKHNIFPWSKPNATCCVIGLLHIITERDMKRWLGSNPSVQQNTVGLISAHSLRNEMELGVLNI